VELTACTAVKRKRWIHGLADGGELAMQLTGRALVAGFSIIPTAREFPRWFSWYRDSGAVGPDEDGSRGCRDELLQVGSEPGVPTAPQCRLIRKSLETEAFSE